MSKREKAALVLERKIYQAIERGEFTPDYGYLSEIAYPRHDLAYPVLIGPCGCALAAAASVSGIGSTSHASRYELISFLNRKIELSPDDANALEWGYEKPQVEGPDLTNPYFKLGQRLRRFHPDNASAE